MRRITRSSMASVAIAMALVFGLLATPTQAAITTTELEPGEVDGVSALVPYSSEERIADWQKLQFGLFMHWGVYSMFEGTYDGEVQTIGYPEQIKAWMDIPDDAYLEAASQMSAEHWDAAQICQTAKDSGMKYVKITTKHHDGFAMWDTDTTDFNVVEQTAFGQDPIAQLAEECNKIDIDLAFYFSIIDWTQHEAEPYQNKNPIPEEMMPLIEDQMTELLTNYGPISEFWFDMGAPTPDQSERMVRLVNELQPATVVNSRVWNDKGDFEVGGDNRVHSELRMGPWESILSIFPQCWSYCSTYKADRSPENVLPKSKEAITALTTVISGGGQYAFNIGPKGDGSIDPFDQQVLDNIGTWMDRHPTAITGAQATWFDVPDWGRITVNGSDLYLFVPSWTEGEIITLPGLANNVETVQIDGTDDSLEFTQDGLDLNVTLRGEAPDNLLPVVRVSLDGPPTMVPGETVVIDDLGGTISETDVVGRLSAKGKGFTALDGYVLNPAETSVPVSLKVAADGVEANAAYRVWFDDRSVVLIGKDLIADSISSDFVLGGDSVGRVRIEYANPAYYADALNLSEVSIDIIAGKDVTPPTVTVTGPPVPGPTVTATVAPPKGDLYQTPGFHEVNGRHWMTVCEPYSATQRCWTYIHGTNVQYTGGKFVQVNGWNFNNLTYVAAPRGLWEGNKLAYKNRWTAGDGRKWRTDCETAETGRNGCRSWVESDVIEYTGSGYRHATKWVFNNIVRFDS